ncbi:Mpv17 / PMP22 family [Seminavis robusta]|uniref:Mpv17 / PMP22 family n=1 Tax=Seminavis robusta TaxID=568900 RepID=A0A9N8EEJ0_9STRA|nr:Mpv17 / PMP22 family [Seminavis robusta]|eukprot:Sro877_g214630.1 Mpv17 / PMP22 family (696) ;mRNA; f:13029-15116
MGNTHVHEKACGDCPAPSVVAKQHVHVISSVRSVDKAETAKACKNNSDNTSTDTATTTKSSIATTTENTPETESTKNVSSSTTSIFLKTIKSTLQDIFDPVEPERLPPKRHPPKQLIYGCQTAEQHFDYIDAICDESVHWHGKEGLDAMGFEFRLVHHPKTCTCPDNIHANNKDDDDLTDSEAEDDEEQGYMEESDNDEGDNDDGYGQFDDEDSDNGAGQAQRMSEASSMVPVKEQEDYTSTMVPLNDSIATATIGGPGSIASASPYASSVVSRNTSTASLFSLATHNTDAEFTLGTLEDGSSLRRQRHGSRRSSLARRSARFPLATISSQQAVAVMEQDSCALRLHHVQSGGTLVTPENHLQFIPDGKFYDELARFCMEYSQQIMLEEADLEWVPIPTNSTTVLDDKAEEEENDNKCKYNAMVSRSYMERRRQRQSGACSAESKEKQKTLVIITGKGQVHAGIFSRRHLLVTSMEAATSLPFTRGAQERGMGIIMLDPNALGYRMGMDVVENSLKYLFLEDGACNDEEEIYVLGHSMAGAQIVRFFTSNSCSHSRPATPSSSVSDGTSSAAANGVTTSDKTTAEEGGIARLLKKIRAVAFTDSNHNINWTKRHPELTEVLTGPKSLYIKSHKVHEKAKSLGEKHHDCQFWRHRFGDIKTLWAGTHEHALTNYTARAHIWEHFDTFLKEQEEDQQ